MRPGFFLLKFNISNIFQNSELQVEYESARGSRGGNIAEIAAGSTEYSRNIVKASIVLWGTALWISLNKNGIKRVKMHELVRNHRYVTII